MVVCGYNDPIGDGLRSLIEGMVMSVEQRAKKTGLSVEQLIQEELADLQVITSTLERKNQASVFGMYRGLNLLATAFFHLVKAKLEKGNDFASAGQEVGEQFVQLLESAELRLEDLRQKVSNGQSESAIECLAKWVKQHEG